MMGKATKRRLFCWMSCCFFLLNFWSAGFQNLEKHTWNAFELQQSMTIFSINLNMFREHFEEMCLPKKISFKHPSGQSTINPQPECFGHFGEDSRILFTTMKKVTTRRKPVSLPKFPPNIDLGINGIHFWPRCGWKKNWGSVWLDPKYIP